MHNVKTRKILTVLKQQHEKKLTQAWLEIENNDDLEREIINQEHIVYEFQKRSYC